MHPRTFLLLPHATISLFLFCVPNTNAQSGLFARIETNAGDFRIALDFERAPRTVASFVALAAGTQPHVDYDSGKLSDAPFYDGHTFEWVSPSMIGIGSPDGEWRGPGYTLSAEFDPALNHGTPFAVAMVNSARNTIDGQFVITLQADPSRDSAFPVFGTIVSGEATIQAIAQAVSGGSGQGSETMVIESVTVEPVGSAATAFLALRGELPVLSDRQAEFVYEAGIYSLETEFGNHAEYLVFASPDLRGWSLDSRRVLASQIPDRPLDLTKRVRNPDLRRQFYRVIEIEYPEILSLPPLSMARSRIVLNIDRFGPVSTRSTLTYEFISSNSGEARNGEDAPIGFGPYSYSVTGDQTALLILPADLVKPLNLLQTYLTFTAWDEGTFSAFLPYAIPETWLMGEFRLEPYE